MRLVIQRVRHAAVRVDDEIVGQCEHGMLILVGVGQGDDESTAAWLAKKSAELRMFADADDKMNLSIKDVGGSALAVSQFTLLADCQKGRRPAFTSAAPPDDADRIYRAFVDALRQQGVPTQTGVFAADMQITLLNDGPVTFVIDR
ncbi:MAG: D-aminoacyl-tRNA deacylase [Planctomycetota bacterium]